jgi:hypothetical protein
MKMYDIQIGNLRNGYILNQVRADRGTSLGNPFEMTSEAKRDDVCDAFDEYFKAVMKGEEPDLNQIAIKYGVPLSRKYKGTPSAIRAEIERLKNKANFTLMCWCIPKRCHLLTIKNYLEGLNVS